MKFLIQGYLNEAGQISSEKGMILVRKCPQEEKSEAKERITFNIRPEKIKIGLEPLTDCENCSRWRIQQMTYLGTHLEIVVGAIATGDCLRIRLEANLESSPFSIGVLVYLGWHSSDSLIVKAKAPKI